MRVVSSTARRPHAPARVPEQTSPSTAAMSTARPEEWFETFPLAASRLWPVLNTQIPDGVPLERPLLQAAHAAARLDGRGLRRTERTDLQHTAVAVESRVRGLDERLTELAPSVRDVGERHRAWQAWAAEREPQLRRYLAVEAELAGRGGEIAKWQERNRVAMWWTSQVVARTGSWRGTVAVGR